VSAGLDHRQGVALVDLGLATAAGPLGKASEPFLVEVADPLHHVVELVLQPAGNLGGGLSPAGEVDDERPHLVVRQGCRVG